MNVTVLSFARVRELLPQSPLRLDVVRGACVADAWDALVERFPALRELASSTRIARNGQLADLDDVLAAGDELALLPPVGGG